MSNSSGNRPAAQNMQEDFLGHYTKMEDLRALKKRQVELIADIEKSTQEGHEHQDAIFELEQVKKQIDDLEAYIHHYGIQGTIDGGRRKKHRRTHRRSKSRRSKSRAKKGRRSKH